MPMSEAGKGHDRRPRFITTDEWDRRYEKAFAKIEEALEETPRTTPPPAEEKERGARARH